MLKLMLSLMVVVVVVVGVVGAVTESEWIVFKSKHGKTYHKEEDSVRRVIWEDNLKKIAQHNEMYARGESTFYLGENQFADMTTTEFGRLMNGFGGLRPNDTKPAPGQGFKGNNNSLPVEVDWVKQGYVTPIKNQGQCGSCWSFSSTGALEAANFKKTKRLVSLSEKNLMDCTWSYGNKGCGGGWMDYAFQYVITNRGIDTEQGYPYYPRSDYYCHYNSAYYGGYAIKFADVPAGSESGLQEAVATVGPVSVAIDATHYSFQLYRGGIYNEPQCSTTALDHAVLVVGYGNYYGQDYWLVKNSWGTYWGESGYIRMTRNRGNQCGIATKASYPLV